MYVIAYHTTYDYNLMGLSYHVIYRHLNQNNYAGLYPTK